MVLMGSLSKRVFDWRTSTGSGLYILGQCFCPNLPANCFYKGEETSQYKFGGVKGKGVISGWRASIKLPIGQARFCVFMDKDEEEKKGNNIQPSWPSKPG